MNLNDTFCLQSFKSQCFMYRNASSFKNKHSHFNFYANSSLRRYMLFLQNYHPLTISILNFRTVILKAYTHKLSSKEISWWTNIKRCFATNPCSCVYSSKLVICRFFQNRTSKLWIESYICFIMMTTNLFSKSMFAFPCHVVLTVQGSETWEGLFWFKTSFFILLAYSGKEWLVGVGQWFSTKL